MLDEQLLHRIDEQIHLEKVYPSQSVNSFNGAEPANVTVVLTAADTVHLEPVRWLWPGFIPSRALTILAGPPGAAKTTMALSAAAIVSAGKTWPGGESCDIGDVLIWSGEDEIENTLAPRLVAAGANMARVHFVTGIRVANEVMPFDPSIHITELCESLASLEAPRLIVLDPVSLVVARDANKAVEVRRGLQPLIDLARQHGCAIVGISHLTKGSIGKSPVERVTGSLSFGALARAVLIAMKCRTEESHAGEGEPVGAPGGATIADAPDRRILVRAKSNLGPDGGGFAYTVEQVNVAPGIDAQRIVWQEPLCGDAQSLLATAEGFGHREGNSQREEAPEAQAIVLLRQLLSSGPAEARAIKEIAQVHGIGDKALRRARETLAVTVERRGFGAAMTSFWSLPATSGPREAGQLNPKEGAK